MRRAPRHHAVLPARRYRDAELHRRHHGQIKGALRTHREYGGFASAILSDFEIPDTPRYLTVAPISHVAGTKVLPSLIRGGTWCTC